MSTELSADKYAFLDKLIADGRFNDRRDALDYAVELLRDEAEALDDVRVGLDSIQRGEGTPLAEAVDRLRREYDIPSDA